MNRRRDGTLFPVEVSVTYMTLGTKDYMVAVVRDITERKQADQALRTSPGAPVQSAKNGPRRKLGMGHCYE